jgi:type IV pilus assembly protein PilF
MKKISVGFLLVLLIILLAGCVQTGGEKKLTQEQKRKHAQQSAKLHTELAAEYYHRGQYEVAIEEVEEAFQAAPNYAPAFNMMGLINMSLHVNEKARKNFEQALNISPDDSEIHNNYGWFLCQRLPEKMDQAIGHFMTALSDPLYKTPEISYTNAGICELKRNNFTAAKDYFNNALSKSTAYPPALIGLIEVDFNSGNLTEAKSKLSHYMRHSTQTPESLWLAVKIERKIGDRYAEESYAYQLMKRFPNSKEASALREGRYE